MVECVYCHGATEEGTTLCAACEGRFFQAVLRCADGLDALRTAVDASLRPGGPQPSGVPPTVPPTPARLDVLDLIDQLDAIAYELLRRLDGVDAHPDARAARAEDLKATLWRIAGHPMLGRLPDAGMYMASFIRIAAAVDARIDPSEPRREIGVCELCGATLSATRSDQWATCPTCGREQSTRSVKLRRLRTLCWDDSKRGSAADVARAFADAGLKVSRKTITTWETRGRLPRYPDGYAYCDVYRILIGPADLTSPAK